MAGVRQPAPLLGEHTDQILAELGHSPEAIAALRANDTIEIEDCANVATSFPNFVSLAKRAGLNIKVLEV